MDCRRWLLFAIALGGGCLGCTRAELLNLRKQSNQQPLPHVTRSVPVVNETIAAQAPKRVFGFLDKEPVKKRPHPIVYVKWAEVRESEATAVKDDALRQKALWDEARKGYQEALKLHPNYLPAQIGLGRVYSLLGERARAVRVFQQAVPKARTNAQLWYEFGMCQGRQQNWREALYCFEQAVRHDPENRHYRKWLGLCQVSAGNVEQGVATLSHVLGAKLAHYNTAGLLARMGRPEQSRQHLHAALQQDPNFEKARTMLASLTPTNNEPIHPVVHFQPLP